MTYQAGALSTYWDDPNEVQVRFVPCAPVRSSLADVEGDLDNAREWILHQMEQDTVNRSLGGGDSYYEVFIRAELNIPYVQHPPLDPNGELDELDQPYDDEPYDGQFDDDQLDH